MSRSVLGRLVLGRSGLAQAGAEEGGAGSFAVSAVIFTSREGAFALDALVLRERTGSFTVDAWSQTTISGSFAVDAVAITGFHLDAYITPPSITGSATADAIVTSTPDASFEVEALVGYYFRLDAIAAFPAVEGSFAADAWLQVTVTPFSTANAVIFGAVASSFVLEAEVFTLTSGFYPLDAEIAFGLADDRDDVAFVVQPGPAATIITNALLLTDDPTDPEVLDFWTYTGNSSPYSGWIGLRVTETARIRVRTIAPSADYIDDTIIAIWGPQAAPPGVSDDPYHISDDAYVGLSLSSLHDRGSSSGGTHWEDGHSASKDTLEVGLLLTPGDYWIAAWPFWAEELTVEAPGQSLLGLVISTVPSFTLGASITGFHLDAVVAPLRFTADALRLDVKEVVVGADYTFESGITGWSEDNWSGYTGTADIAWAEFEGNTAWGALSITFTNDGNQATLGQISGRLVPGDYQLSFWIKRQSGSGNLQWGFGSYTSGTLRASSTNQSITTSWVQKTRNFTVTETVNDPVIWIASWGSTTQTVLVDEVTVKPRRTIDATIINAKAVAPFPSTATGIYFINALIGSFRASFTANAWKLLNREVTDLATYTFGANVNGWTAGPWVGYTGAASISWDATEGITTVNTSHPILPSGPGALRATFISGGGNQSLIGAVSGRLIAGKRYFLAFWAKRTSGSGNFQYGFGSMSEATMRVSSGQDGLSDGFWTRYVLSTPTSTPWPTTDVTDPVIWFSSWGGWNGSIVLDDIALRPTFGPNPFLNARISVPRFTTTGSFAVDASLVYVPEEFFLLRAVIWTSPVTDTLSVDAVLVPSTGGTLALDAIVLMTWPKPNTVSPEDPQPFTLDAVIEKAVFTIDAVIVATTRTGSFSVFAWKDHATTAGSLTLDSWIDSYFGEEFTIDAVVTGLEKLGSFSVTATTSAVGERRGQFTLDALRLGGDYEAFILYAEIVQAPPFTVSAYIQPAATFTLDAALVYIAGAASFSADATLLATRASTAALDATFSDAGGDTRTRNLDAVLVAPVPSSFAVLAQLVGSPTTSFTLNAVIPRRLTLDAFIQPSFTVGAYIQTTSIVVYPPSQEGSDGTVTTIGGSDGVALDGVTFYSPSANFTSSMVGATITIGGIDYIIASVIDGQTITVTGPALSGTGLTWSLVVLTSPTGEFDDSLDGSIITIEDIDYVITGVVDGQTVTISPIPPAVAPPPAGTGVDWHIPSGSATDPLGGDPPVARAFSLTIEWKRPYSNVWHDITGDVIWRSARFTQSARVGAGPFTMSLRGAFDEFTGGEEVRVSIDGLVSFGGYVLEVEYGYAFEDEALTPITTLSGADYNIILDRQIIYNAEWDEQQGGSGGYKPWRSFAVGTMDREIITTVARRFMSDPAADGFDFDTYVDEVDTPAPVKRWAMEPGTTLRRLLSEITRITEGVFWIDAYKNLQYHDRSTVTAPFPITDGDAGISCRGLTMSRSLSVVVNDVFVWGTEAFMDTGDSDIIYARETADSDWDIEYYSDKIDAVDTKIERITDTPSGQRTQKQKTELASLRRTRAIYVENLATAEADTSIGSVERLGRWQHGEFRQDIYHQQYVDRRARAIMKRYSEPVVKAEATIFDPGFQAGQVVAVSSLSHGMADDLVVREMVLDFPIAKGMDGEEYIAVPRYKLSMGLDPEEPWDIYEYLPFPDIPFPDIPWFNPTIGEPLDPTEPALETRYLDTFTRTYESDLDFGTATSDRDEIRTWED